MLKKNEVLAMTLYPRHASGPAGRRSRFTLLELLVVIAVITILVGIVIGGVGIANRKAAEAKTRALLTQLEIALDQYKQQFGYFPQQTTATPILKVLVEGDEATPRRHGLEQPNLTTPTKPGRYFLDVTTLHYDSGNNLLDAFDNKVYYMCGGTASAMMNPEGYDLWTAGADGNFGTSGAKTDATQSQKSDAAATNSDDLTNWKRN